MASKVGEAYVLVHTRTRPLTAAQKRALRKDAGDASKAWTSRFGKEVEEAADRHVAGIRRKLADAFAKGDFDALRKEFKSTDETVRYLRRSLNMLVNQKQLNRKEFDALTTSVNNWEKSARSADAAMKKLQDDKKNEAWAKMLSQAYRMNERHDDRMRRLAERTAERDRKMYAQAYRMNEQFTERQGALFERQRRQREVLHATAYRMNDEFNRKEREWLAERLGMHVDHLDRFGDQTQRAMVKVYRIYEKNSEGATIFTRDLRRMNRQMAATPDILGTMFGRGSRNNFLNFLGSVVRNVSRLPLIFSNVFASVVDRVVSAGEAFRVLAPQVGVLRAAFTILRAPMAALAPLLVGFTTALIGLAFAVPVIFSLMTMLAGSILAVAGALVNALAAGLVAFGPILLGVGAAVGAVVVMFAAWEDASAEVKAGLDPMIGAWNDLKNAMRDNVLPGVVEALGHLGRHIADFQPLLLGVGEAIGRVFDHLHHLLWLNDDVKRMVATLTEGLPGLFETFGRSINLMIIGIMGLFAAVLPQAQKLADGLERMMERFVDFTTSERGQNKIADWMDSAWEAAENLWTSLSNIKGILDSVFNAATEGAGGNFLQWLADATERLDKWLKTPEGQTALTDFFEDVNDFMRDTKDLIFGLAEAWDSMDTSKAREDLGKFIGALESLAAGIEFVGDAFSKIRDGGTWVADLVRGLDDMGEEARKGNPKTQAFVKTLFNVEGDTWDEITGNMWSGFKSSLSSGFDSWWGENETTKAFVKQMFNVEGETWGDIVSDMWTGLKDAFVGPNPFRGENETTKGIVKDLFKVDGETWREISTEMVLGFMGTIDQWGAEARKPNPKTQQVFRDIFNVQGETWGEITSNMWSGFQSSVSAGFKSWLAPNKDTQQFFRDLFNVEGDTWGEILDNMWSGFKSSVVEGVKWWLAPNEDTQEFFRQLFNVEGETWGEILDNMWSGFVDTISRGFASWIAPNETTQQFFRDLFNVDGETWGEITTNMWNGFVTSLGDMMENSAAAEGMKFFFKDLFNVDGETWSEIGTNIVTGLHQGINDAFASAGEWIAQKLDEWIVQPTLRFLQMASPSQLFADIGTNIVLGLLAGLQTMWATLSTWFMEQWENIKTTASTKASEMVENVTTFISELPGRFTTWLSETWNRVETWFGDMKTTAVEWTTQLVDDVVTWFAGLPGKIYTWLSQAWDTVSTWFGDMKDTAVEKANALVNDAVTALTSLPGKIGTALVGLAGAVAAPFQAAYDTAKGWWDKITGLGSGGVSIPISQGGSSSRFAAGGIITRPTRALMGEAGPEAVIPLSRHLSLVDPSVRALSALLQGQSGNMGRTPEPGKQIIFGEGSIVVQTMATNIEAVAEAVVDRIVVQAGL